MANKSLLLALTCAISASVSAQSTPIIVNVAGAPVKILGVTASGPNFLSQITVQNVSSQRIASVQFGIVMAIPEGCGQRKVVGEVQTTKKDTDLALEITEVRNMLGHHLPPSLIGKFAFDNSGKAVHTQVAVVEVKFEDGSLWRGRKSGETFDDRMLIANGELLCGVSEKASLARVSAEKNCSVLTRVQMADGGGYYKCAAAKNQGCTNSVDARSCTNTVCNGTNCPDQNCAFQGGGGGNVGGD